jgi:hypothetical protein
MTYTHKATCRFDVASWTEKAYVDIDPGEGMTAGDTYYPKRGLTEAEVSYRYTGEIEGSSTLRYLNAYKSGAAPVLGLEQFTGSIAGQEGTCVLMHIGSHEEASVTAHLEVVPGMGTGGLQGLRGEGDLQIAGHSENGYELVLSYDLD